MATQSVVLRARKFGYVDQRTPDTHYTVNSGTEYRLSAASGRESWFYMGDFEAFPDAWKYYRLDGVEIVFPGRMAHATYDSPSYFLYTRQGSINWDSLTWNNKPGYPGELTGLDIATWGLIRDTDWHDLTDTGVGPGALYPGTRCRATKAVLLNDSLYIKSSGSSENGSYVRRNLVAGGDAYIIAYVNPDITPTPIPQFTECPSGTVDQRGELSFAWETKARGDNQALCDPVQQSAQLIWSATGYGSHTIDISGSTTSYTAPAGTFPAGVTVTAYMKTVTDLGTHTGTSISFDTYASQITPASYPSGTSVDSRIAQSFRWTYTNGYFQESAIFYWKESSESSYHQIAIPDGTNSVTVPGYTFQTGETIQWYVKGTDTYGNVSQSSVMSFTCATGSIALSSYPQGSNVNTGESLTFTWSLTTLKGDLQQQSATLYWKKSSEGSYHSIAVSSSLKRCIVPANTFPTSATVQWYVVAVDSGGKSYTSDEKSFNSVAPTVTLVTYPSGSGINYGAPISFTWKLASGGQGDYTQNGAKFYWRKDTQDPWTQISVSGNTKSLTIPAYTFPPNQTITWYIDATDFGGATTSTGQKTFKTAKSAITPQNSPTSGYADPRNAITFSWYFTDGENTYGQQSASLKWRVAGAENWNTVAASGSNQSVTVAANTFPLLSNIEWMLTGTDLGGAVSETTVYTFSTTASTAYAVCGYPIGRVIDGSKEIVFTWTVRNSDGSEPSRTILQWKKSTEAATEWRTVLNITDPEYSWIASANTFPAGPIDWKVVAYNRDSVAGPESLASFVCVAAPDTPTGLSVTAVPRTLIRWQPTGQKAYEIQIDGKTIRSAYGPEVTSWQVMEPLEDGQHTIRVRIQGEYGLWSDWAETTVSIANVADGNISLTGKFRVDGDLRWNCSGTKDAETIAIFRDEKWIGTAKKLIPPELFDSNILPDFAEFPSWGGIRQNISVTWNDEKTEAEITGSSTETSNQYIGLYDPRNWEMPSELEYGINYPILFESTDPRVCLYVEVSGQSWTYEGNGSLLVLPGQTFFIMIKVLPGDPVNARIKIRMPDQAPISTFQFTFKDRFALGEHTYRVENWYADGYYTRSNEISGRMVSDMLRIAPYEGGDWMPLKLSENSDRKQGFKWSQKNAMHSVTGSKWPVLETAPYEELSASYDCAFTEEACVKKFEQLRGKVVILKSKGGNVVIGGLTATQKTVGMFYTVFSFAVSQCHWEDFVNDDAND